MNYLSRFSFHVLPGRTGELESELKRLAQMVSASGGINPRVLHTHFASPGAPDIVFEQEAADLAGFETQMKTLTDSAEFQNWTKKISTLISESPKREIYLIAE